MDTEKITIDLVGNDLEQIDGLVKQGFYSNQSDFIRTAIRSQLAKHANDGKGFLKLQLSKVPPSLKGKYSETSIITTTGIVKLGRNN